MPPENSTVPARRDARLDNMKLGLMLLVVLGHLLEYRLGNSGVNYLYVVIYLFHMPAFAFLSGCVTRFDGSSGYWKKTVTDVLLPYLVFDTIYQLLSFWQAGKWGVLQYTTPYWLMWFLLALFVWRVLLALFVNLRFPLSLAVLLGLAATYFSDVGYYLSLSRALSLFPFFLLGTLLGNRPLLPRGNQPLVAMVGMAILLIAAWHLQDVSKVVIYRSAALFAVRPDVLGVMELYVVLTVSALTGIVLLQMLPARQIPYVTSLATGIIGAYLLHGMLVRFWLPSVVTKAAIADDRIFVLICVVIAVVVVGICSALARQWPQLFNFRWLDGVLFAGGSTKR